MVESRFAIVKILCFLGLCLGYSADIETFIPLLEKESFGAKRAVLEYEKAEAQKKQSRAALLPTVDLKSQYEYNQLSIYHENLVAHDVEARLSLNQKVLDFQKFAQYRVAKQEQRLAEVRIQQNKNALLYSFCASWGNVWAAQKRVENIRKIEDLKKKNYESTLQRFQGGELTQTDVSQMKLEYQNARKELLLYQTVLEDELELLRVEYPFVQIEDEVRLPRLLWKNQKPKESSESNLLLQSFELQQKKAEYEMRASRNQMLPSLTAGASYLKAWNETEPAEHYPYDDLYLNLTLSVPIFSGGEVLNKYRVAKTERKIKQLEFEEQKRAQSRLIVSSANRIKHDSLLLALAEEKLSMAEQSYVWVQQEYESGSRSTLEVTLAQNSILNASNEIIEQQLLLYLSVLEYLFITDKLNFAEYSKYLQSGEGGRSE